MTAALSTRISSLAARATEREQSRRDSVREKYPEIPEWGDRIRRDFPGGKHQAWAVWELPADGTYLVRGGNLALWEGTWVDLSAVGVAPKKERRG